MAASATGLGAMEAVIFDLDGVATRTAELHAQAWKQLFDEYLAARARSLGEPFRPFNPASDYRRFVDGKPRYEGVVSFLRSRGIELALGSPGDPEERETVCGLGNRKNRYFRAALARSGGDPYPTTLELISAIAGVEAGRRGDFALVVDVDRGAQFDALTNAGADVSVGDLAELAV